MKVLQLVNLSIAKHTLVHSSVPFLIFRKAIACCTVICRIPFDIPAICSFAHLGLKFLACNSMLLHDIGAALKISAQVAGQGRFWAALYLKLDFATLIGGGFAPSNIALVLGVFICVLLMRA
jgi:hypothetical protein